MSNPSRAAHDDVPVQIRQSLAAQRAQQSLFELDEFSDPVVQQDGGEAASAPIPSRAAPAGAADGVVLEEVIASLAKVTTQTEEAVKRAGVIETLRACDTLGLLKGHPILQRLFLDMYDETKRNRLLTSSRGSSAEGKPPVAGDAVASGADRPSQGVSPQALDVEMVESADSAADGDFAMVDPTPADGSAVASGADPPSPGVPSAEPEVALSEPGFIDSASGSWVLADKAPSITVPSTSGDYAWVEHEDVELLQAWVQEQLDAARDPQTVLPQIEDRVVMLQKELPFVSVMDLFSKSHPWWGAVCRWYCVPEEVGMVKGQKLSSTVLARWNCLRREDRVKILSHVDATSKEFHQDPSQFVSGLMHMKHKLPFKNVGTVILSLPSLTKDELLGSDRAVVQCVDASKAVYRLVSPEVMPDRFFRSDVATILRSLPKLVVEKMVAAVESEDSGLFEDAILNIGGHLRSRVATLRQEEILKKQGQGFGTVTAPAPDGSSWRLVEGAWQNTSNSFREDFKYKFGADGRGEVAYSSEDLAQKMEDQAFRGLLFASDLDCPRFDSQDGPEQKPHEIGVVDSPDMANARITLEDAAHQAEGAATFAEAVNLENKTHRGKVLRAAAGAALAVLQCHSKLVAWASSHEAAASAFRNQGADIFTCCERDALPLLLVVQKGEMAHVLKEYADVPTVRTVLTKLGMAICNLRTLMETPDQKNTTLLDVVPGGEVAKNIFDHLDCSSPLGLLQAHSEGNLLDFGQQGWEHFDSPAGPVLLDAAGRVLSLSDVTKVEASFGPGVEPVPAKAEGDTPVASGADGWTPKPERPPTDRDIAMENLKQLEQAAMEEGTVDAAEEVAKTALLPEKRAVANMAQISTATLEANLRGTNQGQGLLAAMRRTLAPREMTFDKEEKAKREENKKRNAEQLQDHFVYTPVVQQPSLWSRELVELVERHAEGVTGELSSFQERDPDVLGRIQSEVVEVHKIIQSIPNVPEDIVGGDLKHQADIQRAASFFNPALFDKPFPELKGTKASETLEDQVRTLNAMLQMCKKQTYLTGWRWVRQPGSVTADEWYAGWTDLGHEAFASAMHSVNAIFAKHGLAQYSLQIPEMVGNLLNPMVALSKPVEEGEVDREPHHWRLNLQTVTLRELLNCYGSVLSAKDIWNMVGPTKNEGQKKFQRGFPLVRSNLRKRGDYRAARRKDFLDLRLKAKSWMEARGFGEPKCPEDYAIILRRMSFEVHCMNFLHNPSWLEDLPDAPVVDSKERLRLRAEYDHRVTLPIDSLPLDQAFFSGKHKWAVAFQYYRCTGGAWVKAPDFVDRPNRRHWIHMECGMVLPALSGFDYTRVGSSKRSKNRYACTLCRTEWGRDSAEGKWLKGHEMHGWLLEIFDGDVVLQAIVTAPPQPGAYALLSEVRGCRFLSLNPHIEGSDGEAQCPLFTLLAGPRSRFVRWLHFASRFSVPVGLLASPMDEGQVVDTRHRELVILTEAIWERFQPRARDLLVEGSGRPVADQVGPFSSLSPPRLARTTLVSGPGIRSNVGDKAAYGKVAPASCVIHALGVGRWPRVGVTDASARALSRRCAWDVTANGMAAAHTARDASVETCPADLIRVLLLPLIPWRFSPWTWRMMAGALLDPDVVAGVKATWLQSLPEDRSQKLEEDFTEAVTRLQLAASGCPSWTSLSPVGQLLADRAFGRALPMERRSGKRSWEHWAPREGPVKQLALDRAAKKKWADKIISVLAPYHRHLDNMQDIKPGEDKCEVWRPLVGKARVNSLKSVFYSLKKLRSTLGCSPLPFSEDMAKALLYEAVDQQFTIYRLGQLWRTLHWIPQHFGGFDPTVNQAINRRYEYTRGLLVSSEAKKERRATPPPMEVVIALEKLAGTLPEGSPDGYAASFFRFCIGASARFSDTAHTRPDSMKVTKDTLEFTAWQTKVKEAGDNNRPQPLIAPLVSFSQTEWWGPMIALSKRRNSLATKGLEDDYLLPDEGIRFVPEDMDAPYYQLAEEPLLAPPEAQLPVLASANTQQEDKRADGPAFMATNARKTGSPPVYRVHWFDRGYRCLGCGLQEFGHLQRAGLDTGLCLLCEGGTAKQPPDCFLGEAVTKDSSSGDPSDGLVEPPHTTGAVATGADPLVEGDLGNPGCISPADLAYFRPESVLALINSHVIGPSQQPPFCILLGPAAILGQTHDGRVLLPSGTMDRPNAEVDAKLTLARPPELCPDPYKDEVTKIDEQVRLVLARHQVPWLVLFVMGKQGFVTAQDWAGRWDEKELRKEAPKLGFSPGQNGYDEHTCVLTAIRLENAVEQFKLLKKRKMAEVDIHSVEDYKAMIGRGDRQEMRAAYLAKFGTEPEREYEGSDHMLGVLKRVLYRGEFLSHSQLDLNKVVANHPKDGEVKFQKRQSKEDDEWIHEESNRVQSEKQWKRVLMIWRTSLLMVVATCTGPSCIHLTKADLDDFYNFLFGDTIMGREPAPSLGVLMTAERKVWRQVALNMAKDETLTISAALKEIQNNSRFWFMEIDEFCLRRHHTGQPKGPRKGRGKGKDKDKGKVFQQWDYWKGKGKKPGKGKGKSKKEDWRWSTRSEETVEPPPPPEFCKKYHAFNRCPGDCGLSHNCPVILPDGKICATGRQTTREKPVPIPYVLGSYSEFPEYASDCSSGGYHGNPSQPTVLILYAGKDDARSTKAAIAQDVLSEETFSDLCALALSGDLMRAQLQDAHLSLASGPRPPAFLLEHPEDPANQCKDFAGLTRMKIHCFDQCMLGHGARKPTAVLSNLALDWDGLRCRHPDHPVWWSSSDLARWGWQFNLELATSLLAFFSTSGDTDGDRSVASALAPVTASTLIVRLGHRSRPLRDGGGKPSPGRLKPEDRCKCKLAWLGQGIEETLTSKTVATGPRRGAAPGQTSGSQTSANNWHHVSPGQPFALDILQALVELAEDPVFLWLLVFVDDFMAVMKESLGEIGAATLMLFLTLLGCPISWHKNALGKVNRWLGYMVNISEGSVWLPEEKLAILRPALLKLEAGELHTRKEVTSLLGKLQWVAKAYPQVSSHLQPLYAWEQKLERKWRPGDLVRFLATLLISILDSGPCVPLRFQHNTPCYGSSDAGEDDGRVAIGGWFSPLLNPTKAEVLWFSMDVLTTPWVQPLLAHTSPKRRIGALELLGTLILFLLAAESVGPCMIDAHLPLTTDNEGNAFSASKRSSKKWPCSALLMELSAQEFHKGVFAQVTHVKRSSNTWADQLTHFDFEGFSPGNRREVSLSWSPSWMILDKLLAFKSEQ
ncbi:MKK3 [Symbiodinium sp. CCMP2592]|nr:MKK3 [Symbiodinium sp. CCMP2592]